MTRREILIGIDAGTSVIKAVAFDRTGVQLDVASTPNRYRTATDGRAVQSMAGTWADCTNVLRALAERVPDLARAVIEGPGLAARDCHAATGPVPAELRLAGGATRSVALRAVPAASA